MSSSPTWANAIYSLGMSNISSAVSVTWPFGINKCVQQISRPQLFGVYFRHKLAGGLANSDAHSAILTGVEKLCYRNPRTTDTTGVCCVQHGSALPVAPGARCALRWPEYQRSSCLLTPTVFAAAGLTSVRAESGSMKGRYGSTAESPGHVGVSANQYCAFTHAAHSSTV